MAMQNKPQQEPAKQKQSIWDSKPFEVVVSLLLATALWLLVTTFIDTNSSTTRTGEVNYAYGASTYTALGLDIVETGSVGGVTVRFEGSGSVIGGIRASDFVVYPNYSGVTGAGRTTLELQVRMTNTAYSGVTAKIISPSSVEVVFDTVSEKIVPVRVETKQLEVASEHVLSRTVAVPAEVTLRGPTSELDGISEAIAPVALDGALHDSCTVNSLLELRDENGVPVHPDYVDCDSETAAVTLTVHKVRELPLVVDFINTPVGFDADWLNYTLSRETLTVQGPSRIVDGLSEVSVASLDLGLSFAPDRDYQLPVELPNGLAAQDGISTVTLSFDTTNIASKTLNVSNIRLVNVPSSVNIEVLTNRINGVVLYGPAEEIEQLSADSVMAQIDCQSISVSNGQQVLPVSIQIPASSHIFATGSYTVQCQMSGK